MEDEMCPPIDPDTVRALSTPWIWPRAWRTMPGNPLVCSSLLQGLSLNIKKQYKGEVWASLAALKYVPPVSLQHCAVVHIMWGAEVFPRQYLGRLLLLGATLSLTTESGVGCWWGGGGGGACASLISFPHIPIICSSNARGVFA
jgi:hypothetical protein